MTPLRRSPSPPSPLHLTASLPARIIPPGALGSRRARHVLLRNAFVARRIWYVILSGLFEPFLYLLSIGVGVGKLVGDLTVNGQPVRYAAFVAPGMLAASAMNGAIYECTINIFFKLKFHKTYDAMLATPLGPGDVATGEVTTALIRGTAYAAAFVVAMLALGLIGSWWALLAVPAATLIGFAFAAIGMAATTFMRSWRDFDLVNLATLPLFLFSATFYPLDAYPPWLRTAVWATPLFHGVALERALTTGAVGLSALAHVAYLLGLGALGLAITGRRLRRLLLS